MSPERQPRRRRRILIGVAALIVVLIAAGAVYALTRGGDVNNPGVEFHAEPTQTAVPDQPTPRKHKKGKQVDPLANFVWGDYGYTKDRRRYLPASFKVRPPFHRVWGRHDTSLLEFTPILVGQRLYEINNQGYVESLTKARGKVVWRKKLGTLAAASPGWGGGRIYVSFLSRPGSANGLVAAMRPRDGKVLWKRDLPSRTESSPLYINGTVYYGSEGGTIYAVSAKTGRTRWTYQAAGAVKAALSYANGKLYFGDYGGRVYAVGVRNGHLVWRSTTHGTHFGFGSGNFYSTPSIAFGRVYIGNTDGSMYSFAADSGRLAWSHGTGSYVYASPGVAQVPGGQPTVYFGSYDGNFYAVDARTGATRWTYRSGGRISGAPTIVGNVVYFSDSGMRTTTALNAVSGKKIWEFHKGAFNPVISDGRTIFLTGHSTQYAFRPKGVSAKAVLKPTTVREARRRQRLHRRKLRLQKRAAARRHRRHERQHRRHERHHKNG